MECLSHIDPIIIYHGTFLVLFNKLMFVFLDHLDKNRNRNKQILEGLKGHNYKRDASKIGTELGGRHGTLSETNSNIYLLLDNKQILIKSDWIWPLTEFRHIIAHTDCVNIDKELIGRCATALEHIKIVWDTDEINKLMEVIYGIMDFLVISRTKYVNISGSISEIKKINPLLIPYSLRVQIKKDENIINATYLKNNGGGTYFHSFDGTEKCYPNKSTFVELLVDEKIINNK